MNPVVYKKITGSSYPLSQIIDAIIAVRAYFPNMTIHLNATIIRGMNNEPSEMEKVIKFATRVGGEAKLIDLASSNQELIVFCEEIEQSLNLLGFKKTDGNRWQSFFVRTDEKVIVTRCGFSEQNRSLGNRNLFLSPDGKVSNGTDIPVEILREVHSQDIEGIAKKIEWYFSPAKRI